MRRKSKREGKGKPVSPYQLTWGGGGRGAVPKKDDNKKEWATLSMFPLHVVFRARIGLGRINFFVV